MQRFSSHLNGFAACEEVCNAAIPLPSMYRRRPPVVCPKPRRVGQWVVADLSRDLRPYPCSDQAADFGDSANGAELLEILKKDSHGEQEEKDPLPWSLLSSSPPYFCGSPPRRASNPLIHDPDFLQGKFQHQLQNSSLTQSPFMEQPYTTTTQLTTIAAQFPFQPPSAGAPAASGFSATATATPTAGGGRRACLLRSRDNFGPGMATVRVEGFDCLNRRDGRGCSISAFA